MKISALNMDGNGYLISFNRHDYKETSINSVYYMIDGGFDYVRTSEDGKVEQYEIKDFINEIREQFEWTRNFDENNKRIVSETKLLKDLSSSHICGILSYFNNIAYGKIMVNIDFFEKNNITINREWCIIHEIFIQELNYRIKYNLM